MNGVGVSDGGGFDSWYSVMHPRLVSSLTVIAGDAGIAAEVTDEAFVRAYERWARVSGMVSPTGWTFRTALNVLRRHRRRFALERSLLHRSAVADRDVLDHAPADWSVEMWDALRLRRLPVRERTAIALRYVADLPTDAIAEAMGVAPGSVGSTLHRARGTLARILEDPVAHVAPRPPASVRKEPSDD